MGHYPAPSGQRILAAMLYIREDYFDRVGPLPPLPPPVWRRLRSMGRWLAIAVLMMSVSASTTVLPSIDGLRYGEYVGISVLTNGRPVALVGGATIELMLSPTSVGARVGCNSMGGPAGIENGRLVARGYGLDMTIVGCAPGGWEQDTWLLEFLDSRPVVTVADERLLLTAGQTTITLVRKP